MIVCFVSHGEEAAFVHNCKLGWSTFSFIFHLFILLSVPIIFFHSIVPVGGQIAAFFSQIRMKLVLNTKQDISRQLSTRTSENLQGTCKSKPVAVIGIYLYMYIFLRKNDCFGCAVLLCLVVCLTLLASFFLPSHLSLKHLHVYTCS